MHSNSKKSVVRPFDALSPSPLISTIQFSSSATNSNPHSQFPPMQVQEQITDFKSGEMFDEDAMRRFFVGADLTAERRRASSVGWKVILNKRPVHHISKPFSVFANTWVGTNSLQVNKKFLAFGWKDGRDIAVISSQSMPEKPLTDDYPVIAAHRKTIYDFAFSPHDDHLLATGADEGALKLWKIPLGGIKTTMRTPLKTLKTAEKGAPKVTGIQFSPASDKMISTITSSNVVNIWHPERGVIDLSLHNHKDTVFCATWNSDGSTLATCCADSMIRLFDVRASGENVASTFGHDSSKCSRAVWLDKNGATGIYMCTTGFNQDYDGQIALWDTRSFKSPITMEIFNRGQPTSPMIFYDETNQLVCVATKGGRTIAFFSISGSQILYVNESSSQKVQRGTTLLEQSPPRTNSLVYRLLNDGTLDALEMQWTSAMFDDDSESQDFRPSISSNKTANFMAPAPPKFSISLSFKDKKRLHSESKMPNDVDFPTDTDTDIALLDESGTSASPESGSRNNSIIPETPEFDPPNPPKSGNGLHADDDVRPNSVEDPDSPVLSQDEEYYDQCDSPVLSQDDENSNSDDDGDLDDGLRSPRYVSTPPSPRFQSGLRSPGASSSSEDELPPKPPPRIVIPPPPVQSKIKLSRGDQDRVDEEEERIERTTMKILTRKERSTKDPDAPIQFPIPKSESMPLFRKTPVSPRKGQLSPKISELTAQLQAQKVQHSRNKASMYLPADNPTPELPPRPAAPAPHPPYKSPPMSPCLPPLVPTPCTPTTKYTPRSLPPMSYFEKNHLKVTAFPASKQPKIIVKPNKRQSHLKSHSRDKFETWHGGNSFGHTVLSSRSVPSSPKANEGKANLKLFRTKKPPRRKSLDLTSNGDFFNKPDCSDGEGEISLADAVTALHPDSPNEQDVPELQSMLQQQLEASKERERKLQKELDVFKVKKRKKRKEKEKEKKKKDEKPDKRRSKSKYKKRKAKTRPSLSAAVSTKTVGGIGMAYVPIANKSKHGSSRKPHAPNQPKPPPTIHITRVRPIGHGPSEVPMRLPATGLTFEQLHHLVYFRTFYEDFL